MPRLAYRNCRRCGRHADEAGLMSWTRLCGDCARVLLHENIDGLHTHSGPALDRWRRGMAAAVGGVLVDDLEALVDDSG